MDKNEKIQNLFEELETSEDKEKIYKQIYDLTQNTFVLEIKFISNKLSKNENLENKKAKKNNIEQQKQRKKRYDFIQRQEGSDPSYLGSFDYKNWNISNEDKINRLYKIGERLDDYLNQYPLKLKYTKQAEPIKIFIQESHLSSVKSYMVWLENEGELDFFKFFHLGGCFIGGPSSSYKNSEEYYSAYDSFWEFQGSLNKETLRKMIFNTDFKNYEYRTFFDLWDCWNVGIEYLEEALKAFWSIPNLKFKIEENICSVKSDYGVIKISINSFINIFLSTYDVDSYCAHPSYFDCRAIEKYGYEYGSNFQKNMSEFCIALDNHKRAYGFYKGIDKECIWKSLMPMLKFDDTVFCISYEQLDIMNTNKYPALIELAHIGLLTFPRFQLDITQFSNVFTKEAYLDADSADDYIRWLIHAYNQLKEVRCYELAEVFILLGTINTVWHDKLEDQNWIQLMDIIKHDSFSSEKREILFDFIYNNFPSNTNENCLYFQSHFSDLITAKKPSSSSHEYIAMTEDYTRNMQLGEYSMKKIENHFSLIQWTQNVSNFRDNITLNLFLALEDEAYNFLVLKEAIEDEEKRNTSLGNLMFTLHNFVISSKNSSKETLAEWKKIKREMHQLIPIRNKSAHPAPIDADDLNRAQTGVKIFLEWFSKFKLKFI